MWPFHAERPEVDPAPHADVMANMVRALARYPAPIAVGTAARRDLGSRHLDARLNLARKSQILTRDLSLPIVPVSIRRKTSATASSWSGSTPTRASP